MPRNNCGKKNDPVNEVDSALVRKNMTLRSLGPNFLIPKIIEEKIVDRPLKLNLFWLWNWNEFHSVQLAPEYSNVKQIPLDSLFMRPVHRIFKCSAVKTNMWLWVIYVLTIVSVIPIPRMFTSSTYVRSKTHIPCPRWYSKRASDSHAFGLSPSFHILALLIVPARRY